LRILLAGDCRFSDRLGPDVAQKKTGNDRRTARKPPLPKTFAVLSVCFRG
jgi:hypothetical protein